MKFTKDARKLLQKFALPATKLGKNVKAPSAGCCEQPIVFTKTHSKERLKGQLS